MGRRETERDPVLSAEPVWTPDVSAVGFGDRTLFPKLDPFAYLAHAAISPLSTEVLRAVTALHASYAERGVTAFGPWRAQRERLRGRVGELLGVDGADIAFVANTTSSVIAAARSIPWKAGDRILCFRGEFPTNVTPWQRAAADYGLTVDFLDADAFRDDGGFASLEAALAEGVRLVAVSAVQFQTGLRMPLEGIARRAHAAGAEVFVDAIQALGAVPLNAKALGIDYLGCGSHKFLMSMEGVGLLYVRRDRQSALVPRLAGWLSHEDPFTFLVEPNELRYDRAVRQDPSFLEAGAPNAPGLAALEASLAGILSLGVDAIHGHAQAYLDPLEEQMTRWGFVSERSTDPTRRSASLAMRPPPGVDLAAFAGALLERGVVGSIPDGRIRLAPQWPNAQSEVPRVLEAAEQALAAIR